MVSNYAIFCENLRKQNKEFRESEEYKQFIKERQYLYNISWRESHKTEFLECVRRYQNKKRHCAKKLCKDLSGEDLIIVECRVCGEPFGVIKCEYEYLERIGKPRKYCSYICSGISKSKAWQEKSPYAKKVKELRKIHGV